LKTAAWLFYAPALGLMNRSAQRAESLPETAEATLTVPLPAENGIWFDDRAIVVNAGKAGGILARVFASGRSHQPRGRRRVGLSLPRLRFNARGELRRGPAARGLQPLKCEPDRRLGHGPAKYYRLKHTGALLGFIGALTTPHFCAACNKLRLTADGRIRVCLGNHGELDLRRALRESTDDACLREIFLAAIRAKPLAHQFHETYQPARPMVAIGG
jgi:hypothetical protein